MPILKQSKKRAKQNLVRRARNYKLRTGVRKAISSFNEAINAGNKAEAEKLLSATYKVIDTAVKKGILQANTAARRKSSLVKAITTCDVKKKVDAPKKKITAKKVEEA